MKVTPKQRAIQALRKKRLGAFSMFTFPFIVDGSVPIAEIVRAQPMTTSGGAGNDGEVRDQEARAWREMTEAERTAATRFLADMVESFAEHFPDLSSPDLGMWRLEE